MNNNNPRRKRVSGARRDPSLLKTGSVGHESREKRSPQNTKSRISGSSGVPRSQNRSNQTGNPSYAGKSSVSNNSGSRVNSGSEFHRSGQIRSGVRHASRELSLDPKRAELAARRQLEAEKWQNEVVRVKGGIDIFMLVLILLLLVFGTITVFSASYPLAFVEGRESNYYYIRRQLVFAGIGIAVMTFEILLIPIKFYSSKIAAFGLYALSIVLLIYTYFKGNAEGEAVRWIRIFGVNVQPSEIMKVSLILMIAWYAENRSEEMQDLNRGFKSYIDNTLIPCIILGISCCLVLIGKHLSGTIIVGLIGFLMLIIAGCKQSWLFGSAIPAMIGAGAFYLSKNPYALKRITTFTDSNADKLDELYQTTQSIYAIGSGGLFGVGIGQSRQKYSYLTQAHTDFIFSIWCEEWGFAGAVMLIVLFILFIWRGYVIALRAPTKSSMLIAFGITTHVGLQAFLNMCVASDVIMNTGITLPFFSYGGSSLFVLMAEMGVLLSISRQYYRKKSDIEREEMMKRLGMDV